MILRTLLVFALGLASVSAQTTVVRPAAWTNVDSPSGNAFPFGASSQQFRYLNVHDDLAGTPGTISAFALRRSGTTTSTVTSPIVVVVDGWMSTAATTGATVVASFDANHGSDKQQVLTNRTISFPSVGTGTLPYPFAHIVPLDTPFPFAGSGPLCWEVQITSRPMSASVFYDYVSGTSTNPSMVVSKFGNGCTASGRSTPFTLTGASSNSWSTGTGSVNATAMDGPANAPAVLLLGFTPLSVGIPLPGTASGSSGLCEMFAVLQIPIPGMLNAAGDNTFRVPVPLQPSFNGAQVYGQVAAPDMMANPLGIVVTNGIDHQIVAPYGAQPGGRVYDSGSLGATGTVGAGQTLVVQFTL